MDSFAKNLSMFIGFNDGYYVTVGQGIINGPRLLGTIIPEDHSTEEKYDPDLYEIHYICPDKTWEMDRMPNLIHMHGHLYDKVLIYRYKKSRLTNEANV